MSSPLSTTTDALISHLERAGYALSLSHEDSMRIGPDGVEPGEPYVEVRAVRVSDPDEEHVVVAWGDDEQAEYDAVCGLVRSIVVSRD